MSDVPTAMVVDVSAIQRVRCPYGYVRGPDSTQVWTGHEGPGSDECGHCDGRGWLYSDPPEWWTGIPEVDTVGEWEWFCELTWRVLDMYQGGVDE